MPQAPFLFAGTVGDNIRYARADATDEEVLAAARQVGGGDWLDALPDGLATEVGEHGGALSMGQRQLVALARVLVQDPAIVILDEATASVDPLTEAQIQEGLDAVLRDRTSIVIAHRLSTIEHADRIIVLDSRPDRGGGRPRLADPPGRALLHRLQHLLPAPVPALPAGRQHRPRPHLAVAGAARGQPPVAAGPEPISAAQCATPNTQSLQQQFAAIW